MLIKDIINYDELEVEKLHTSIFSNKCPERPLCSEIWQDILKQNRLGFIENLETLGEPNAILLNQCDKPYVWILNDDKIDLTWIVVSSCYKDGSNKGTSYELICSPIISDSVLAKSAIELFKKIGYKF